MAKENEVIGKQLGPYLIERCIGRGGMAEVFLATHQQLHRQVAIKLLRVELATSANLQRFLKEARSAAALVHPNIVQVYDIGQADDIHYIAQEYIAGSNLKEHLNANLEGRLSVKETLSIVLQVAAALERAAAAGITHRDIKPENILIAPTGEAKVADFGLARAGNLDGGELTRVGMTLGTPLYMSPEQIRGGDIDPRSDLYSLGVTMYHMLSGSPPFQGETLLSLAVQHLQTEPPRLKDRRPDLPDSIVELVAKLMSKEPDGRPQSATELLKILSGLKETLPSHMWPETVVPLPTITATSLSAANLRAATKELARISKHRFNRSGGLLIGLAAAVLFLGGLFAPWGLDYRPAVLVASGPASVEQESSVSKQFMLAMYQDTEAHWLAVSRFFPPTESAVNRIYCDKATLHLARWYREHSQFEESERLLVMLMSQADSETLFRTLAAIELASISKELGRANDVERFLADARKFGTELKEDQKESVNDWIPNNLRGTWKLG